MHGISSQFCKKDLVENISFVIPTFSKIPSQMLVD